MNVSLCLCGVVIWTGCLLGADILSSCTDWNAHACLLRAAP